MPSRATTPPLAEPSPPLGPPWLRRLEPALVALLIAAFAFLAVGQARSTSATTDEILHLPAGYAALRWADHRLDPRQPPLVRLLAAIPLSQVGGAGTMRPWPAEVEPPPGDVPLGQPGALPSTLLRLRLAWASALQDRAQGWLYGHLFLYGIRDTALAQLGIESRAQIPTTTRLAPSDFENDADLLLFEGRLAVLLLALGAGGVVFWWARALFGPVGGLFALLLFCFDPNLIAHGALVTTDLGLALFALAAVFFLWRACRRLRALDAVLAALAAGLAMVSRFSALLLLVVVALLLVGRALHPRPWPVGTGGRVLAARGARLGAALAFLALVLAVSGTTIWSIYGFRYAAARDPGRAGATEARLGIQADASLGDEPGHFPVESTLRRRSGAIGGVRPNRASGGAAATAGSRIAAPPPGPDAIGRLILLLHRHRWLPEAYVYGLAIAHGGDPDRATAPKAGRPRSHPVRALVLKTPLPTLAVVLLGLLVLFQRQEARGLDAAFVLAPALAYGVVALTAGDGAGQRSLLPVYPFLYVASGGVAAAWARRSGHGRPGRLPLRVARWAPTTPPTGSSIPSMVSIVVVAAIVAPAFLILAPPWRPALVYPHYLAYANELAGDPRIGPRRLVDPDLDRGQDLPGLRAWLERNGGAPLNLSLFGLADPLYYGIPHLNLPGGYPFEPRLSFARDDEGRWDVPAARRPGYLAISATNLAGVFMSAGERAAWQAVLAEASLVDVVGYSIFVYRLGPRPGTVYEEPFRDRGSLPEAMGPGESSF